MFPFSWMGWDQIDTLSFQFYDVIFTGRFGEIEAGYEFDLVFIDYESGTLEAWHAEPADGDTMPDHKLLFIACPLAKRPE